MRSAGGSCRCSSRRGHSVVGTTRTPEKVELLRALGAEPDAVVAASRGAGVSRFVAQSFAGWPYAPIGDPVKTEDDALDPEPPRAFRAALEAIRHLERAVVGAAGIVLRYGALYGPGTSLDGEGEHVEGVRRRRFPIVAGGGGVWSFVHVDDAAAATLAALERGEPGVYNVVDDDPAPVADCRRSRRPSAARRRGASRHGWRESGRRARRRDDDDGARSVEREGEACARVDAAASVVAQRLPDDRSVGRERVRPGARPVGRVEWPRVPAPQHDPALDRPKGLERRARPPPAPAASAATVGAAAAPPHLRYCA